MGLISALNTAVSGLGLNQRQLEVTAANIANADRAGYTKKTVRASATVDGSGRTLGVYADGLSRSLNIEVQNQYRASVSQQQYAEVKSSYAQYLDQLFGTIDDPGSLPNTANAFVASISELVTSPENYPNRLGVLREASRFAAELNSRSIQIQDQRQSVEFQIGESVDRVNTILNNIRDLDLEIVAQRSGGGSPVELEDERDRAIEELAGFVDITVKPSEIGGLRITTTTGVALYDVEVFALKFDAHGSIGPGSLYSVNAEERGVGTVTPSRGGYDLIAAGGLGSGSIAALIEARDVTLVNAQRQLDELAANLALAFSTHEEAAAPYPPTGTPTGYDFDLAKLAEGDSLAFSFKDLGSGLTKNVTIYRSDGPGTPDLTRTNDPNDIYIGIDFSNKTEAEIAAAVQDALSQDRRIGPGVFSVTNPLAPKADPSDPDVPTSLLRLVSNNPAAVRIENAHSNIATNDVSQYGDAFALFVDSDGNAFTGLKDGRPNVTGFASRIKVNGAIIADPGLLVEFAPGIASGDPTRPQAILERLTNSNGAYTPAAKVGTDRAVYKGSITGFITSTVSYNASRASEARATAAGQDVVTNNLRQRLDSSSKVDVDEELGRLIQIQNAYQANARVLQAARELFEALLRT